MATLYDAFGNYAGEDETGPGVRSVGGLDTNISKSKSSSSAATTSAPSKAPAAPSGSTTTVFTGLCDAINKFQKDLVKPGGYKIADVYEIQFAPATIAESKITIPGTEYKTTPTNQQKTPNTQLNPEAQRMDTSGRIVQLTAGTQIVQFIDQVMRGSTYITDQSNFIIEENTGKLKPKPNAPADAEVKWYKISFQAKSLGWDEGRNDYAYKMIYTISPYTINRMDSQYFPEGRYHGVHKSYNYWFTGKNNSVLNFEQDYNNMFFTILSGTVGGVGNGTTVPAGLTNALPGAASDAIGKTKSTSSTPKSYAPAASVSNQGAANAANEIGASAADYLYAMEPPGEVKLRIIGDPAWIAQGEITNSVNAATINFSPFLPDGTINMDAGEVMFDLYFNRPSDYNFDTGIVDVSGKTINPGGTLAALQPQAHLTYTCTSVKSYFNQGKFEQEITGKVYADQFGTASKKATENASQQQREKNTTAADSIGSRNAQLAKEGYAEASKPVAGGNGTWDGEPTGTSPTTDITNPSPQPAAPAGKPTSNGDITAADIAAIEANRTTGGGFTPPADAAAAVSAAQPNTESQTMAPGDD